jgi:hypothetical protein
MYKLQEVRMKEIHLNCIEITGVKERFKKQIPKALIISQDVIVPIPLGRSRSLTPGSGSLKCPGWVFPVLPGGYMEGLYPKSGQLAQFPASPPIW